MSIRMSGRTAAPVFALVSIGLVGCEAPPDVGASGHGITLGYTPPSCSLYPSSFACGGREGPLPADLVAGCTEDRWVGYQLTAVPGACPRGGRSRFGRWVDHQPFAGLSAGAPTELARFCVYEWQPHGGYAGPPVISDLPDTPDMRVERDCEAVTPLFTPGASRPLFEAAYASQMNLAEVSPLAAFPSASRTRLAVVDTAPTELSSDLPSAGADGHGFVVGGLAREASCLRSGGTALDCAARIKSYQGMPLGDGLASFGRPIDVAIAMAQAIDDWANDLRTTDNLLINLSLGWDGKYGARHGPEIRMTALAPWLVAQWAACEGALVIAAAGNRSQIGGASGPMFPGGWEQDGRLCAGTPNVYSPLVHAAGAVNGADVALRMARPSGTPRLIAPSAFATASAPKAGGGVEAGKLVSGTSVSAAGLSGVAALVWALAPHLTPEAVMEEIYRGGVFTSEPPDFAFPPTPWVQARLDACGAAARVCQPSLGNCPLSCTQRPIGTATQADFRSAMDLERPGLRLGPATPGVNTTFFASVPLKDEVSVEPHAGPQPGGTLCPLCYLDGGFLIGQLEPVEGMQIGDVFFRPTPCGEGCDPDVGGVFIHLPNPTDPFKVDMSDYLDAFGLESAMLEVSTFSDGDEVVRASEIAIMN